MLFFNCGEFAIIEFREDPGGCACCELEGCAHAGFGKARGCGMAAASAKINLELRRLWATFARLKNDIKSGAVRPGLYRNPSDLSYHPSWYHVCVVIADRISLYKKIIIPHEAFTVQV